MSIATEITRLQNAKAALKSKIESEYSTTIPNSVTLEDYPGYMVVQTKPTTPGVYIIYSDNSWSNYDILTSGKTPMGVGLVTSNQSIIIHKTEISAIWGSKILVDGCTVTNDSNLARTDFAGKTNTDAIIATFGTECSAYQARNNFSYENGAEGYLPSLGQLYEIALNYENINTALGLISGDSLTYSYCYSSTQYSNNMVWVISIVRNRFDQYNKTGAGPIRSVADL